MTIAISIRVGEGLVYAADSTSTLFETIDNVSRLAQSFHHAQKLIHLADAPIGILTFGLGLIGSRNLESLVAEFESEYLPELFPEEQYQVNVVAQNLLDFLARRYDEAMPPPGVTQPLPDVPAPEQNEDTRPYLGVIVGGYSYDQFYPEEYVLSLPGRTLAETRPRAQGEVGVRWWGQTVAVQRALLGFDPGVLQFLVENGVDPQAVPDIQQQLIQRLGWKIAFDGMPLQDAIDFAVFLTNLAIGHSRFVVGPPVCGGHVDVATISHRGFNWVRQKTQQVKSDSAFF